MIEYVVLPLFYIKNNKLLLSLYNKGKKKNSEQDFTKMKSKIIRISNIELEFSWIIA